MRPRMATKTEREKAKLVDGEMKTSHSVKLVAVVIVVVPVFWLCFGPVSNKLKKPKPNWPSWTPLGEDFNNTLFNISIVRVPDTEGSKQVRNFITAELEKLDWNVTTDEFEDNTPLGAKKFANVIATLNPSACHRLVLACHYDSKLFSDFTFVAATDSAVPCAILIQLAKELRKQLSNFKNSNLTLQFIFFDGEEAFVKWTATDSIYGARHLTQLWRDTAFPNTSEEVERCGGMNLTNELSRIKLFVLLDLIGAKNPKFVSFFQNTWQQFKKLIEIEKKLTKTSFFKKKQAFSGISDDHLPFLDNKVPILHLIPHPFPIQWHTKHDDIEHLHFFTIEVLFNIFKCFVADYLELKL